MAIGTGQDTGRVVRIQDDGKIVVGGDFISGFPNSDVFFVRFETDGTLDTTFGSNGVVTTDYGSGSFDQMSDFVFDGNGKIISAGGNLSDSFSVVARYNLDGSLDTTFDSDGLAIINASANTETFNSLTLQTDGKIIAAGRANSGTDNDVLIARLNTDGSLDTSFNDNGLTTVDFGSGDSSAGVHVDIDNNITVTAQLDSGSVEKIGVTRLSGEPSSVNSLDGNPTFVEDGAAVVLDADVEIFDAELSNADDFNGASLTLVRNGGVSSDDVLSFNDGNGITLSGSDLIKNGQVIATFDTTTTAGQLVVTFTNANGETPTNDDVNAIMRQIAYENTNSSPPASVQIDWTFNDGNDDDSQGSGGELTAIGSTTVDIVDVFNDADLTVPIAQAIDEDTSLEFSSEGGNAILVDTGNATGTDFRVTLAVTNGTLTLGSSAGITFLHGTNNGDATIMISGTESEINTALDGLLYQGGQDYNGSDSLTVTSGPDSTIEGELYARYEFLGGATTDQSGHAYNGTASGDPTLTSDPDRGDVLTFDGDDRVTVTNGVQNLGDEVTIAAFVNLDAGTQDAVFLSLSDEFFIVLDPSNTSVGLRVATSGFSTASTDPDTRIGGEGWVHVAATLNDTTKELKLYLNGELIKERTFSFADIDFSTATDITIGSKTDGTQAFAGSLDDVRIYDAELSETEINELIADEDFDRKDVAITVNAVNDTPDVVGPGTALQATEQTALNIHGAGFSVTDVDAASGTMTATFTVGEGTFEIVAGNSGVTIDANTSGTVSFTGTLSQINSLITGSSDGTIIYNNSSNSPSASTNITLTVNDGGNTGSDPGTSADASSEDDSASQTINIASVNDAPSGADKTITINEDTNYVLTAADFGFTDVELNNFDRVVITSRATNGLLFLDAGAPDGVSTTAERVAVSQEISVSDITEGRLIYAPGSNDNGTGYANFTFQVADDGGTANGGADVDPTANTITFDVTSVDDSPSGIIAHSENVLLSEDFNDGNSDGWTLPTGFDGTDGNISSENTNLQRSVAFYNDPSAFAWTDVKYSTDLTIGDNDAMGVVLRYEDADNYVALFVSGNDGGTPLYRIFEMKDGVFDFVAGADAPEILQTETLTLTATVIGDNYSLQVNGDEVLTATIMGHDSGTVGTFGDFQSDSSWDNLLVTRPELTVAENAANDTIVGTATGFDNDAGDTLTYSLTNSAGGRFKINSSGQILVADGTLLTSASGTSHTITIEVNDGTTTAYREDFTIALNQAPVAASIEAGDLAYTENGDPVEITDTITFSDADDTNIESATVQITSGFSTGQDVLAFTAATGVDITGAYDSATGILTLTGSATLEQYQEAIRSITYANTSDDPSTTDRTVSFTINDGDDDSNTLTRNITVTAVNDAPELAGGGGIPLITITEDDVNNNGQSVSDIFDDGAGGSFFSDADGDPEGIAITINNSGNGLFEFSTDDGATWTAIGVVSNNAALLLEADDRIRFVPDGKNGQGSGLNIGFRAWDGTEGAAGTKYDFIANGNSGGSNGFSTQTRSALQTVTSVNDAPVLDNSGDIALNTQAEDAGAPSGAVGTLISDLVSLDAGSGNVTDVDNSATTGVAITGADTTNGTYFYSTNGGSTWIALGSVSDSSARVLRADSNTRIYFQSNQDYNGTVQEAITFRAWDRTQGSAGTLQDASTNGGTTAFSSDSETADITVTAENDAPAIAQLSSADDDAVAAYDFENGTDSIAPGGPAITIDSTVDNPAIISDTAGFTTGSNGLLFPTGENDSSTNPVSIGTIPGVATSGEFSFSAQVRFDAGDGARTFRTHL